MLTLRGLQVSPRQLMNLPRSGLLSILVLCLAGAGLIVGCRSPRVEGSDRAAAVVVTNCASDEITAAARSVFLKHGFQRDPSYGKELAYRKKAGFMKSAMSNNWFSGAVWTRIRLYQRALDSERTLVNCDVFEVQEPEDPLFETQRQLSGKNREAQKLLDELANTLRGSGATAH